MLPNAIEVVHSFVEGYRRSRRRSTKRSLRRKSFIRTMCSSVLKFSAGDDQPASATQAPQLVEPSTVAPSARAARVLSQIRVDDVDAVCAELRGLGVALLNGPVDRPWGRRTAAFADPSGHVWEVAQELGQAARKAAS